MSDSGQVESGLPSALSTRLLSGLRLSLEATMVRDMSNLHRESICGKGNWCLRGRFERPSRRLKGGFSAVELRRHVGARPAIRTRNLRFLRPAPLPIGPAAHVGGPVGSRTPATRLEDGCSLPARQGL